ncbi:hypothetical protein WG66_007985 [Moniliophthora roreri]|nr:hypothetical protein WG66_007985 [Moniliophthora roreri]
MYLLGERSVPLPNIAPNVQVTWSQFDEVPAGPSSGKKTMSIQTLIPSVGPDSDLRNTVA